MIEVFAQLAPACLIPFDSAKSYAFDSLSVLFGSFWGCEWASAGPGRMTKNLSGSVVSVSSVVSANCFCFFALHQKLSQRSERETPQRERASIAPVFPASQVNSTDDRLAALMDGMVRFFSLCQSMCTFLSLSFSVSPACSTFSFFFFFSFTLPAADVAPPPLNTTCWIVT